jgi:hypothetical protein
MPDKRNAKNKVEVNLILFLFVMIDVSFGDKRSNISMTWVLSSVTSWSQFSPEMV